MVSEPVGPGHWNCSPQAKDRASSPMNHGRAQPNCDFLVGAVVEKEEGDYHTQEQQQVECQELGCIECG